MWKGGGGEGFPGHNWLVDGEGLGVAGCSKEAEEEQ